MTVTRRQVLVAAAAAPLVAAAPARADLSGDAAVLYRVAQVELTLRYAYQLVSAADLDAPELQTVAMEFAAQEAEHLGALATSLEALGSQRPSPPRSPAELDRAAATLRIQPGFTARTDPRGLTEFLLELERASERTLETAAARLADMNLLQTSLTILGCQAQHRAVLEMLLRDGPG